MKKFTKQISSLLAAMAVGASGNPGLQIQTAEAVEVTNGNTRVVHLSNIESSNLYEYYEETMTTTTTTAPEVLGTYYDHGTTPGPTTTLPEELYECVDCGGVFWEGEGFFEENDEYLLDFYCYDCYLEAFPPTAGVAVAEYECFKCGNMTPGYQGEYIMNRFYCSDCAYTVTQMTVGTQAPEPPVTTTLSEWDMYPTIGTSVPTEAVTTTTTTVTTTTVGTSYSSEPETMVTTTTDIFDIPCAGVTTTTRDVLDIPDAGGMVASYGSGDANLDGVTDLTDLTELSLYLLGDKSFDEYELMQVDVNNDGKVNIADLPTLKMMITKGI
ncbi:MAG: dockerin type I repeat-containing protein [Oscillospiraceae bacterium]|nr:dockerin type I repeat-containing protein [Oscillospiraceae bacterium]